MFIVPVQKRSSKNKDSVKPKTEYQVRPLHADDIQKMSADELRFHELNNRKALDMALESANPQKQLSDESTPTYEQIQRMSAEQAKAAMLRDPKGWKAAFEEQERLRNSKRHVATQRTKLQWQGHATESEDEAARIAGSTFAKKFPQFERSLSNAQAMARYMQENDLPGTDLSSYIAAFRALSEQGKLTLAKAESADEYLQKHPELLPKAVPPLIASQQAKVKATEEHFAKTQAASAQAGSTTVTDYPREQQGVPPLNEIEKASLRALVRNMSASELMQKCSDDPSFKKKLDSLSV